MRRVRTEDTSLSFLDVIACAFGAIVLLVLILPVGRFGVFAEEEPTQPDYGELLQTRRSLDDAIADLTEQIEANSKTLQVIRNQASSEQAQATRFEDAIKTTESQIEQVKSKAKEVENAAAEKRAVERELSQLKREEDYAGIPVDSEYVAIVLDTSSSMRSVWTAVIREIRGVLDLYPELKGFQILSDQGEYLFPGTRGRWMPDSPIRRNQSLAKVTSWRAASASSPAKGIKQAVIDLYRPGEKMAVFIFGDDFSENVDLDAYIRDIEHIAKASGASKDTLRIHAFGFANPGGMVYSELRVSVLMRELTQRLNGAFLALPKNEKRLPL